MDSFELFLVRGEWVPAQSYFSQSEEEFFASCLDPSIDLRTVLFEDCGHVRLFPDERLWKGQDGGRHNDLTNVLYWSPRE